jgi:hypothetical protein
MCSRPRPVPKCRRRSYDSELPTARTTLRTGYVRVLVFCNSCRHQADADLGALVEIGRGDVPLTELRFRCSQCRTNRTDFVVDLAGQPAAVVMANLVRSGYLLPPGAAE